MHQTDPTEEPSTPEELEAKVASLASLDPAEAVEPTAQVLGQIVQVLDEG